LKEENINNGWAVICADALKSREAFATEKKRLAAEKAAAAKKASEPSS
jgi:hypothetical protein